MGVCGSGLAQTIPSITIEEEEEDHKYGPSSSSNYDRSWLCLQFHNNDLSKIIKPNEIQLKYPPATDRQKNLLDRIEGSLIGLAIGDALGAHVEFRPRHYLIEHPVVGYQAGGTWGLSKGQFTDDTSMALCLAASLISTGDFSPYDQLVRYKWWYRYGYMSSTGDCFDIGAATRKSIQKFEDRQKAFAESHRIEETEMDYLNDRKLLNEFNVYCSDNQAAGNGGLMRLAPVPLFFHSIPAKAVKYCGISAEITHGSEIARDACRFYGALIVAALHGESKKQLLDPDFYKEHEPWFAGQPLHEEVQKIVKGSYANKPRGYDDGIRGKGYVLNSLEAALWAFRYDDDSFEKGVLAAVNLGDDTDTTAAIYGQLAGAYYSFRGITPREWITNIYAKEFLLCMSSWLFHQGQLWSSKWK